MWNNNTLNGYTNIPKDSNAYNLTVGLGAWPWNSVQLLQNDYVQNKDSYRRLSNYDCIKLSTNMFSWRPNFLLVSGDPDWRYGLNSTVLNWEVNFAPGSSGLCDENRDARMNCETLQYLTPVDLEHWVYENNTIQYCMVSTTSFNKEEVETCHLLCAPIIMLGMLS